MYPVYRHTGEFDVVEEYFDRLIVEGLDYHPEIRSGGRWLI